MARYAETYAAWLEDPEGFWSQAAEAIDWTTPPEGAFDASLGVYGHWFPGGVTNTAFNCLDRHVASGRGEQAALIYDSPVTGTKQTYTFNQLLHDVSRFGAVLETHGVTKGDRVIVYMPMVPEAAIAMLACARIGAIHSVVFGGFAPKELATRIDDAKPKLIVSASCGIEPSRVIAYKPLLDEAIELARHKPEATIILQRDAVVAELKPGFDFDYAQEMEAAAGQAAECAPMASTDPLYILYTSGTTGEPKGVVRDTGGHMVALKWSMEHIYGVKPGDVYWAASDVGWVVGHSYIVYGPLLHGCTTVLFEGKPVGTPDAGTFWRVIEDYGVAALFTAPTAFRAIKKEDPKAEHLKRYDTTSLRTLFLAGERADPDTIAWAEEKLGVPVIDHWWQTETGWTIAGNPMGIEPLAVKPGSATVPMPGYKIEILDEGGQPVAPGELGAVCVRLPLAPGNLPTLWQNEQRFRESYLTAFPGYYETADAGYMDDDGSLFIMARTDDIINVAGHRLSTGGMEEVLASHPSVAECAVLGIADSLKGQIPVGFIVLSSDCEDDPRDVEAACVSLVRAKIGAVAALKTIMVVDRLPKTRSGKILRATLRKIADGDSWTMPATIDDPAIMDEVTAVMAEHGILKTSASA
ncbi:MAG: propionyl-CoA synthetase [Pseudomonadota bacterium]